MIFAVSNISTESRDNRYMDFFSLNSNNVKDRKSAIDLLQRTSIHTCTIDVQPDDQILLLVTCIDKDTDRRVVAARRIRIGENEKDLKKLVEQSRKKTN